MSKYLIEDSKDILIPSLSDFFHMWCVDNDVKSLKQLDDYAKEILKTKNTGSYFFITTQESTLNNATLVFIYKT